MTEFESRLVTALREKAEEAVMSVDTQRAADEIQSRFDRADRHRRRLQWVTAAAAAVLVVAGVSAVVGLRGHARAARPAASPTPSASTFHAQFFAPPFTMTLPAWVPDKVRSPYQSSGYSWWPGDCGSTQVCDFSVSRFDSLSADAGSTGLTYAAYLTHLTDLQRRHVLRITGTTPTTVDGRPATEVRAVGLKDTDNVLGCNTTSCQGVPGGSLLRYVVVDMGSGASPVVLFVEVSAANPQAKPMVAQLDTATGSIRFGA